MRLPVPNGARENDQPNVNEPTCPPGAGKGEGKFKGKEGQEKRGEAQPVGVR